MRRQLDLFDRNIHLSGPALQRLHHRLVIANQQPVGAFVERQTSLWAQEFFSVFLQLSGIGIGESEAVRNQWRLKLSTRSLLF